MTTAELEAATAAKVIQHQRDQRDLDDIITLRHSEAFTRYYLRKLSEKRTALMLTFKTGTPKDVDKDEREILRRQILLIEEIESLLDRDEGVVRKSLATP